MAVRPEDPGARRGEASHHLAARVPEAIPPADADEGETRGDPLEEGRRRRGPAPVVGHLQDVGREAGASGEEVLSAAASMSPVRRTLRAPRRRRRTREPLFSGRAEYVSGPGVKDLEGDAGRDEPVSRPEGLDRDAAARRRLERLVEEEVPRRSAREVDAIDRQELEGGEEPAGVVGVRVREDDRVERDGPERREARQEARPAEVVGSVERAAPVHEDAPPVGHDQERVPLPDIQGDQPRFARPLGGRGAGRREEDEGQSAGQGGASRAARPERPGRREEEREERRLDEEGRRDDADGAERVEETEEAEDRPGKDGERPEGEGGRERPREEERHQERGREQEEAREGDDDEVREERDERDDVEDGRLDRKDAELGAERRRDSVGERNRQPPPQRAREERRDRRDAEDGRVAQEKADVEEVRRVPGEQDERREGHDVRGRRGPPEQPGGEVEPDHEHRPQDRRTSAGESAEGQGREEDESVANANARAQRPEGDRQAERQEGDVNARNGQDVGDASVAKRRDRLGRQLRRLAEEERLRERRGLPLGRRCPFEVRGEALRRGAVQAHEEPEPAARPFDHLDLSRALLGQPRLGREDEGARREGARIGKPERAAEPHEVAEPGEGRGVGLPRHAHDDPARQRDRPSLPQRPTRRRGGPTRANRFGPPADEPAPDLEDVPLGRLRRRPARRLPVDDERTARTGETGGQDEEERSGAGQASLSPQTGDDRRERGAREKRPERARGRDGQGDGEEDPGRERERRGDGRRRRPQRPGAFHGRRSSSASVSTWCVPGKRSRSVSDGRGSAGGGRRGRARTSPGRTRRGRGSSARSGGAPAGRPARAPPAEDRRRRRRRARASARRATPRPPRPPRPRPGRPSARHAARFATRSAQEKGSDSTASVSKPASRRGRVRKPAPA